MTALISLLAGLVSVVFVWILAHLILGWHVRRSLGLTGSAGAVGIDWISIMRGHPALWVVLAGVFVAGYLLAYRQLAA